MMRRILITIIFSLLLIAPVLAEDNTSSFFSSQVTVINPKDPCNSPECLVVSGDSSSIDISQDGYFISYGWVDTTSDDTYNIVITFSNGETLTGTIIQEPSIIEIVGHNNYLEINGKWFNSSAWLPAIVDGVLYSTPRIIMNYGLDVDSNEYYLIFTKTGAPARQLEIPLDFNAVNYPIESITIYTDNEGEFHYFFNLENQESIAGNVESSSYLDNLLFDYIDSFIGIIGIFWAAILFLFGPDGIFDWLFIEMGIVWIFLMIETGMMAYYSLTSKNIFVFYQKMIRGNVAFFTVIVTLAQGTLQAIKAAVDLVNPIKWIFG